MLILELTQWQGPVAQVINRTEDRVQVKLPGRPEPVVVVLSAGSARQFRGRRPDFGLAQEDLGQDGGGILPCWRQGSSAVCDTRDSYPRPL